jgi:hypothetical protein
LEFYDGMNIRLHGKGNMDRKRVLVVTNKWWECDPIMNLLLSGYANPASGLGWPVFLNHPHRRPDNVMHPAERPPPVPRAIFALPSIEVEVWCISDLLEHLPGGSKYQSSSFRKIAQLPGIFAGRKPELVIAIGTASFPGVTSENGNVVVGTKIFLHNADLHNPSSKWDGGPFDTVLGSVLDPSAFASITSIDPAALDRYLVAPLNPAAGRKLLAGYDHVALGTINVTDPGKYSLADKETLEVYAARYDPGLAQSLETTHGLIRVQSETAFMFVSGIANRVGHFTDEVNPRLYAQNTTAAHNAGVALAWMVPKMDEFFRSSSGSGGTWGNPVK